MALYEHVFIARQDISATQVENITAEFSKVIEENEGKIAKSEYWGLKNLAYKIKKNRKGHYVLLNIDAPHAAVAEMERQARLNEDVMRFMTIRVEELEEGQSIVLRSKADRDRRPPRGGDRSRKEDS
jgi:small subunit ribosomal protein S6